MKVRVDSLGFDLVWGVFFISILAASGVLYIFMLCFIGSVLTCLSLGASSLALFLVVPTILSFTYYLFTTESLVHF